MKIVLKKIKNFIKEKGLFWLFFILMMILCIARAITANNTANFNPINGDFQNFNVVRRLLDGQIPYKEFTVYLGYGHLFLGTIAYGLFSLVGGNLLQTSKVSYAFLLVLSYCMLTFTLFKCIFKDKKGLISIIGTNLLLILLLWEIPFFSNILVFDTEIKNSLSCVLNNCASARFLRGFAPILFIAITLGLNKLLNRFKNIKKHKISLALASGIASGIIIYYSNDYGLSSMVCSLCLFIFFEIISKKDRWSKLENISTYLISLLLTFIIFGSIITLGHIGSYIRTLFSTGGAQAWYYISDKSLYIFQIDWSFLSLSQAFLSLIYLIILIKSDRSQENFIRYGIPLFLNGTAFIASNEYKLLSGNTLHDVAYVTLWLTLIIELLAFIHHTYTKINVKVFKEELKINYRLVTLVILGIVIAFTLSYCVPPLIEAYNEEYFIGTKVDKIGYLSQNGESILAAANLIEDKKIFSTYATALETITDQFHPTKYDYIIHALGDDAQKEYLEIFRKEDFTYVTTINEVNEDWEYWIRNANWYFYRELYKEYEPIYASDIQIIWQKKADCNYEIDDIEYEVKIKKETDSIYKITVDTDESFSGILDLELSYEIKKKDTLGAKLIFNKMLKVSNTSSFKITQSIKDMYYYLPEKLEKGLIAIQINEGHGNITISSLPTRNTILTNIQAKGLQLIRNGSDYVVAEEIKTGEKIIIEAYYNNKMAEMIKNAKYVYINKWLPANIEMTNDKIRIYIDLKDIEIDEVKEAIAKSNIIRFK